MKKLTALTLGSMIMMNSTAFAFSDLTEEHWAYRNVINMQEKGVISGFEDNTFRPSDSLTREQFITMAVKGLNIEKLELPKQFEDVLADRWSAEYILAGGYAMVNEEDTSFRPAEVALREDVAMAIVRVNNLEESEYNLETLNNFSDNEDISENRKKYVAIAVENGFMSGNEDGTFSPKKALTRAEGATVIFNMLNKESFNDSSDIKEDVKIEWNGEFISNVNGLTKVELTKISDTEVKFYIKGQKSSLFGGNGIAVITDNTAKYVYEIFDDKGEINFRFEDSELVIETSGYESLNVFAGRYKVNDGTISSIERTEERNPLEGSYLLGEEFETENVESFEELEQLLAAVPTSLMFEINNITYESADFSLGGFKDGSMIAMMGSLEKNEDKWRYFDSFNEEYTIEIELKDNTAIINGLTEDQTKLNGTYIKKEVKPEDEYREYEKTLDETEISEGVFMM